MGTSITISAMPRYRIYRMKEAPRQQFRWAPHLSGCATLKPKDYELRGEIDAPTEYAAWQLSRDSEDPIAVGDLLETESGQLRICKYVGFEPAEWLLPEPKHQPEPESAAQPTGSAVS